MPRSASDPELKREFAKRIRALLRSHTAQKIASILGVKPQMIYNYRHAKCAPSAEVIRRAMEGFPGLSLSYRGKSLTLQDFSIPPKKPSLHGEELQYELWDAIRTLKPSSIQIQILKKEVASVQLGVKISFGNR